MAFICDCRVLALWHCNGLCGRYHQKSLDAHQLARYRPME
jgi:hypothetical protein